MTAADLASQQRVPLDTLRTWLRQNRFPRERALSIATRLKIAANLLDIESSYEVDFTKVGGRPPKPLESVVSVNSLSEVVVTIGDVSIRFGNTDPTVISSVTAAIRASLVRLSEDVEYDTSLRSPKWEAVIDYGQTEAAVD